METSIQDDKTIFKNCFSLSLNNDKIQQKYSQLHKLLNVIPVIVFLFLFCIVWITGMVLLFQRSNSGSLPISLSKQISFTIISGWIAGAILLISILLFLLQLKFENLSSPFLYFNAICLNLICFFYLDFINHLLDQSIYATFIYSFIVISNSLKISYAIFIDSYFPRLFISVIIQAVISTPTFLLPSLNNLDNLLSMLASYVAELVIMSEFEITIKL